MGTSSSLELTRADRDLDRSMLVVALGGIPIKEILEVASAARLPFTACEGFDVALAFHERAHPLGVIVRGERRTDELDELLQAFEMRRRMRPGAILVWLDGMTETDEAALMRLGADRVEIVPAEPRILVARMGAILREMKRWMGLVNRLALLATDHERVEADQQMAARVFERLCAMSDEDLPWIRQHLTSVDTLSGDVVATRRTSGDRVCVMVADFTGHGLAAAVCAIPAFEVFHQACDENRDLEELSAQLNDALHRTLPPELYCAVVLMRFQEASGRLEVLNAGLPEVLVRRAGDRSIRSVPSGSVPLGILSRRLFRPRIVTLNLEAGDRVFAMSDGLLESRGADGELFGADRVRRIVQETVPSAAAFAELIDRSVAHRQAAEQDDDMTLVELTAPATQLAVGEQEERERRGHWQVSWDFSIDTMGKVDPHQLVAGALSRSPGGEALPSGLLTCLAELYANAVDHGVLQLSSSLKQDPAGFEAFYEERARRLREQRTGRVVITLAGSHDGRDSYHELTVEDSGGGFDVSALPGEVDPTQLHGRGLSLVRNIAANLSFEKGGRRVVARFVTPRRSGTADDA